MISKTMIDFSMPGTVDALQKFMDPSQDDPNSTYFALGENHFDQTQLENTIVISGRHIDTQPVLNRVSQVAVYHLGTWEGYVSKCWDDGFEAKLCSVHDEGSSELIFEFSNDILSNEDRSNLRVYAPFRYTMYKARTKTGSWENRSKCELLNVSMKLTEITPMILDFPSV